MSILCVGEMLIDFMPGKEGPQSFIANPGGAPAKVAVCISRNGGQAVGIPALPYRAEIDAE